MKVIRLGPNMEQKGTLLDQVQQELRDASLKPIETTKKSQMPAGEPWDLIKALYASKDPGQRILASLLNAIFTSKMIVFLFSKRIMTNILEADKNLNRNTLDSSALKVCAGFKISFFTEIRPSSKGIDGKPCAALWVLTHAQLRPLLEKHIGKDSAKLLEQIAYAENEYSKRSHVIVPVPEVVPVAAGENVLGTKFEIGIENVSESKVDLDRVNRGLPNQSVELEKGSIDSLSLKLPSLDLVSDEGVSGAVSSSEGIFSEAGDSKQFISHVDKVSSESCASSDTSSLEEILKPNISISPSASSCLPKAPQFVRPSEALIYSIGDRFSVEHPMWNLGDAYRVGIRFSPEDWVLLKERALEAVCESTIDSNYAKDQLARAWARISLQELEDMLPNEFCAAEAKQYQDDMVTYVNDWSPKNDAGDDSDFEDEV